MIGFVSFSPSMSLWPSCSLTWAWRLQQRKVGVFRPSNPAPNSIVTVYICYLSLSQYELVAELFADVGEAAGAEKGGRVQALKSGPKGGSKQMKRTVGSQVTHCYKSTVRFMS